MAERTEFLFGTKRYLSNVSPAPPQGHTNIVWQSDGENISAHIADGGGGGSQTPWLQDIDGAGHSAFNVAGLELREVYPAVTFAKPDGISAFNLESTGDLLRVSRFDSEGNYAGVPFQIDRMTGRVSLDGILDMGRKAIQEVTGITTANRAVGSSSASSALEIRERNYGGAQTTAESPRISFTHYQRAAAVQFGFDGVSGLRTFDEAGTGHCSFSAGKITSNASVVLRTHGSSYVGFNAEYTDAWRYSSNGPAGVIMTLNNVFALYTAPPGTAGAVANVNPAFTDDGANFTFSRALLINSPAYVMGSNAVTLNAVYNSGWKYAGPGTHPALAMYADAGSNRVTVMCASAGAAGTAISFPAVAHFYQNAFQVMVPLILSGLPTSASGLSSGSVWRDAAAGNVLKMVP